MLFGLGRLLGDSSFDDDCLRSGSHLFASSLFWRRKSSPQPTTACVASRMALQSRVSYLARGQLERVPGRSIGVNLIGPDCVLVCAN